MIGLFKSLLPIFLMAVFVQVGCGSLIDSSDDGGDETTSSGAGGGKISITFLSSTPTDTTTNQAVTSPRVQFCADGIVDSAIFTQGVLSSLTCGTNTTMICPTTTYDYQSTETCVTYSGCTTTTNANLFPGNSTCTATWSFRSYDSSSTPKSISFTTDGTAPTNTDGRSYSGITEMITTESGGGCTVTVTCTSAVDTVTAAANMKYNAHCSITSRGQNFSSPSATKTGSGRTSTTVGLTTGWTAGANYYCVCRTQDEAGNATLNTNEMMIPIPGGCHPT